MALTAAQRYLAYPEAHRLVTCGQARLSAASVDRMSLFIAVLRWYLPLLHPSLAGPPDKFPQLVDGLWTLAIHANPRTICTEEKRLVLRGIASHVARQTLWVLPDIKAFLRPACGLEFFDADALPGLENDSLLVNPSEAASRVEIVESLWLISAILSTASGSYPALEPPLEGLVDWASYRPLDGFLQSPTARNGNMLAQGSCFFRQDVNPSERFRVFHHQIKPVDLGDDAPTDSSQTPLDQMMHYADVGTGKDTVRT